MRGGARDFEASRCRVAVYCVTTPYPRALMYFLSCVIICVLGSLLPKEEDTGGCG